MKQNEIAKQLVQDFEIDLLRAEKIAEFGEMVSRETQKIALISKKSALSMYDLHIFDSLTALNIIKKYPIKKIIDLGSGGGFPAIVLAIACPEIIFYGVESVKKKSDFLSYAGKQLSLSNFISLNERAEIIGRDKNFREQNDAVMARALAPLNVLLEYASPLLRVQGISIFFKTDETEIEQSTSAAQKLSMHIKEKIDVSHHDLTRRLFVYEKIKPTPFQFPRAVGVPAKQPLR